MGTPSKVTPVNPQVPITQDTQAKLDTAKFNLSQSTMDQSNPLYGTNYTTTIDPITGLPKYKANVNYNPAQQSLLDILQGNQQNIGGTAQSAISSMFPQYGGDPNLVGQAGSLTNQALDQQLPAWERFDAPARAQEDTRLETAGILKGTPAYQQAMDALTNQQGLTRGAWLAGFQPQAFNEAQTQYQLPLQNVATMLGLAQPAALPGQLNTPQANAQSPDVMQAYSLSQDAQKFNAQQNNAYWNAILGGVTGTGAKILGMPTSGTVGSSLYNSAVGGMGATG